MKKVSLFMGEKMKLCPFCPDGGKPRAWHEWDEVAQTNVWHCYCKKCGARKRTFRRKKEAIADWNKRNEKSCKGCVYDLGQYRPSYPCDCCDRSGMSDYYEPMEVVE